MRVLFLLASLAVLSCGNPEPKDATAMQVQSYSTEGTIESIAPNGMLQVSHEEIPGYMLATTMPFEASNAGMIKGLKAGDRIRFDFEAREDGRRVITRLEKKNK